MTIYYVDAAGSNTSPYDTKAKAANLLSTIMAIDAAGDTIYIADTHTETPAGPITHACAGVIGTPSKILCIDFGTDALSTGAVIGSTTTLAISGIFFCHGVTFKSGVGSATASHNITIGGTNQEFVDCSFYIATTSATGQLTINASTGSTQRAWLKNCGYHFTNVGHSISLSSGRTNIQGGNLITGSAAITKVFLSQAQTTVFAKVSGFDASLAATSASCVGVTGNNQNGLVSISNMKMPSGWSGALTDGQPWLSDFQIIGTNISASDANYYSASQSYVGKHINDTALYPSTSDGAEHNGAVVKQSHKVTLNASAKYPIPAFRTLDHALFNTVTTAQTATIEIIHNEAANLKDNEVWMELEYLGTSGSSQSSFIDDAVADVLATPVDQTTSTADWDDGLTARANSFAYSVGTVHKVASNPGRAFICTAATGNSNSTEPAGYATAVDGDAITDGSCTFKAMRRQKVSVTFTAAEQGAIIAKVVLTKASAVVWVSSKLTVA